jgi:hypothetical protein
VKSSCQNDVALNRRRERRLRWSVAERLATTLGPAAASPLPRTLGLRPTQGVCEPLPQLLQDGERDHRFPRGSETIGNDNRRFRFDSRLASVDGASAPPTLAHPVSLWGALDPALLSGVSVIETTWVPRDDRQA